MRKYLHFPEQSATLSELLPEMPGKVQVGENREISMEKSESAYDPDIPACEATGESKKRKN